MMLNITSSVFKKIKKLYSSKDIEYSTLSIRKNFSIKNEEFSVFTTLSKLDTMTILFDNKNDTNTRYVSLSKDEDKNYMVLSANRNIEEMRFDAACMMHKVLKAIEKADSKTICPNFTTSNKNFSREDKHFACALLMPKMDLIAFITKKDEKGNYLYLDENNELSFKNVNIIADHFGMPFNQCLSRIYHVYESLKDENKNVFVIKGCYNKKQYKELKAQYTSEQREKDFNEVVTNYSEHRQNMVSHLIDSLHYRSWNKLSEIAKRRILINLVKSDSVNEGVVKSEEEAKAIINNYVASGGTVYDGSLVTKNGEVDLSDEHLVVLGEYELYLKTLERGLIKGITKSNPKLQYLLKMDYKDAINSLNEKDLTNYIVDLHSRLFSNLSYKYGEKRGGFYRSGSVKLSGTNVSVPPHYMVPQLLDNISWRLLEILKKNVDGKLTNSEYINEINGCIYDMIRLQPFSDGNKRVSRLVSNIFYQEKGIPYVLIPVKEWTNYVNAWSYEDVSLYNDMMQRMILDSYKYFYGDQSVNDAANSRVIGQKIILDKRVNK